MILTFHTICTSNPAAWDPLTYPILHVKDQRPPPLGSTVGHLPVLITHPLFRDPYPRDLSGHWQICFFSVNYETQEVLSNYWSVYLSIPAL